MAQPPEYTRSTNFNDFSTSNPSSPHQGSSLDAEFNDIKTTTDTIRTNLALLQRDDGKLANLAVHAESLSNAVLTLIKATSNGYGVKGAWTTDTAYAIGDLVESSQATYLCFEAHQSGLTFGANSSKFILLANAAIQTTASAVDTLSGNGSTVEFTLTNNSPSGVTDVLVFVNGSLRTPTTDYTIPSNDKINFTTAPSSGTSNVIVWGTSTVVEAAKAAAQSARDTAATHKDDANEHKQTANLWANKVDGTVTDVDTGVDSNEFSSKAYANSTDSNEPTTGSSKNWATKAGSAEVQTGQGFSSKAYAQDETTGTDTTGGSSKGWSQTAKNTQVPGAGTSDRSAKHYSEVAADHKNDAETAKTAAETALDSFDDRYLGSKTVSTHPSADNDGNSLLTGALYWNTGSGSITQGMYVYDGSGWDTLQTSVGGDTVTSSSGNNLNLVTPSNSNKVVINSGSNTIQLPNVRASQDNYVLAMSDKTTGETAWQITQTAPTITSVSGLLNVDSDSTLTIIGEDFNTSTTVKLFSAATGGTEIATATVDTSGVSTKLEATFGADALTTAGAGQQCFLELGNGSLITRHQTGITINVDPTATFSGGSGANYSASTHLGTYGIQVAGGGQDSNTKLLLNFDRWGGTDIEDSSNTGGEGHKVPTNGQTSIKASPFGDGKSAISFLGSDDDLEIDHSTDFNFGAGSSGSSANDFTIEFWVYRNTNNSYQALIGKGDDAGSNSYLTAWFLVSDNSAATNSLKLERNGSTVVGGIWKYETKRWYHIALVRSEDVFTIYVDGKTFASATSTVDLDYSGHLYVGAGANNGPHELNLDGYMDEIRIVKGSAVYTGDFDVPTSRLSVTQSNQGTNIADITGTATKLLIHSDQSDYLYYERNPTRTNIGQATSQKAGSWSDGSLDFTDTSSRLYFNNIPTSFYTNNSNQFTIEGWFYPTGNVNTTIYGLWGSKDGYLSCRINGSSGEVKLSVGTGSTPWATNDHDTGVTMSQNTWTHFATVYDGSKFMFFKDGTYTGNDDALTTSVVTTSDFEIGAQPGGPNDFVGYIDEFRISDNARYTDTGYSNQTSAFSVDSNTVLLIHGNGGKFTDSSSSPHTITATGAYHSQGHGGIAPAMTFPASGKAHGSAGVYFDGDQDHLLLFDDATTNKNDIVTAWCTGSWSLDCWLYMTAYPADSNGFTILSTTDGVTYGTDIGYHNATSGGTGYWGWIAGSAFSPQTDQTTDTPALNTWMHLLFVLSWSGTTMSMKVYKDGKYLGSQSYASGSSNTNFNDYDDLDYMTIGGNAYNSGGGGSSSDRKNWNGYIDNYRFSTGDVTADSADPLYTNSQTSTSSNNFVSGLPTKIYGAYTPKIIDTITFTGTTSQALAGDEDIEFSEVTNTNQPAEKQDFSDIGLSITNLTGSDKNKATLTGTLNFAHNTSVPKLAMKVQVRKTLGDASYNNSTTVTFGGSTTTIGLSPGMGVTNAAGGSTIPASTTISSVDSSTQITLSQATTGGSQSSQSLIFTDPDRVAHMNGNDTYSTGDTALTIATGDGNPVLFNARRYHGTGSARDINGFGFQPDFCWIKARNASRSHYVWDSITNLGASPILPDTNSASIATAQGHISSFISDGITIADGSSGDLNVNDSGDQYIAWGWKAGGAPSGDGKRKRSNSTTEDSLSSDTDYSTSISAIRQSVNVEGDFSITKYTGDSTTDAGWFKHGLSGTPDFMIVKNLDATQNWFCWHSGLGASNISTGKTYILLDEGYQVAYIPPGSVNTQDLWTSTGHTSTTINLKNHISMNWVMNNQSFICYAWKAVDKVSAFGSFNWSSSGDHTVSGLSFQPRFVMIKCIGTSSSWLIWDEFRGFGSSADYIKADTDDGDLTGSPNKGCVVTSSSFTIGSSLREDSEWIYIAFA